MTKKLLIEKATTRFNDIYLSEEYNCQSYYCQYDPDCRSGKYDNIMNETYCRDCYKRDKTNRLQLKLLLPNEIKTCKAVNCKLNSCHDDSLKCMLCNTSKDELFNYSIERLFTIILCKDCIEYKREQATNHFEKIYLIVNYLKNLKQLKKHMDKISLKECQMLWKEELNELENEFYKEETQSHGIKWIQYLQARKVSKDYTMHNFNKIYSKEHFKNKKEKIINNISELEKILENPCCSLKVMLQFH